MGFYLYHAILIILDLIIRIVYCDSHAGSLFCLKLSSLELSKLSVVFVFLKM